MKIIYTLFFTCCFLFGYSQNPNTRDLVYRTFKDTRVINTQSVETLPARKLDIRISHRFGDLLGSNGGWDTFYGLENAADVLIGADYGITNNLTIGLNRTKGAGPLTRLVNTNLKYKVLAQGLSEGSPVTLTVLAGSSVATSKKIDDSALLTSFPKTAHRFMYNFQMMIGRKFSDRFSLQITPGFIHRNLVTATDENGLFNLGVAFRLQVTKVLGIITDTTIPFSSLRTTENGYQIPFGIGLEIDTGGHVFQINLTNATGLAPADYIPNTRSNWADGQFRMGFTISRLFNL